VTLPRIGLKIEIHTWWTCF